MGRRYSEEVIEFITNNCEGKSYKELVELVNKKFNLDFTTAKMSSFLGNHHLSTGRTGQFVKGGIPYNKGKKWDDYMSKEGQEKSRKTCFKKNDPFFNNANHSHRSVGSERIDSKDGYTLIKIKPNKWILKHRYIYEQKNGKIPKGYVCIFLDGNKSNFDINNLAIITRNQHKIMNKNKLRFNNPDITATGINVAKLIDTVQKKRRKKT